MVAPVRHDRHHSPWLWWSWPMLLCRWWWWQWWWPWWWCGGGSGCGGSGGGGAHGNCHGSARAQHGLMISKLLREQAVLFAQAYQDAMLSRIHVTTCSGWSTGRGSCGRASGDRSGVRGGNIHRETSSRQQKRPARVQCPGLGSFVIKKLEVRVLDQTSEFLAPTMARI